MTSEVEIKHAFERKREFFDKGLTKSYKFRIEQLKRLKISIKKNEQNIIEALYKDMHRPETEAYLSEIGIIYEEISHTIKHLKNWMKPIRRSTPLVLHPSLSRIYPEPLGIVLIIGPWNYPFFLLMAPLVGAIAAGNCAIVKPSDNTKNTLEVIVNIIKDAFDENYISAVIGPGAMIDPLLIEKYPFNHIFFTGSPSVGKQVMAMASKHLTPVTLELGGKSPAIVDKDADLEVSAKRVVWAKFFNAGQTCISPDYLVVHQDIHDVFITKMKDIILKFYSENPSTTEHLTHIVNEKRFNTLVNYLKDVNIIYGGNYDLQKRYFAPTLIDNVPEDHPIMNEEIFGPILPIFTFKTKEEVLSLVRKNRYPLACYIFSNSKVFQKYIIENVEFGGGCVNNTLAQYANPKLPFGGVGNSGIGRYHGKYSFEVFSHFKSIVKTSTLIDPNIKYPPYTKAKLNWIKRLFSI